MKDNDVAFSISLAGDKLAELEDELNGLNRE